MIMLDSLFWGILTNCVYDISKDLIIPSKIQKLLKVKFDKALKRFTKNTSIAKNYDNADKYIKEFTKALLNKDKSEDINSEEITLINELSKEVMDDPKLIDWVNSTKLDFLANKLELLQNSSYNLVNACSNLLQQTSKRKYKPQIVDDYIFRDEETLLIENINNNGILLLSGVSRCGKTQIARKIALSFYNKGYDIEETDDLGEVKSFFANKSLLGQILILNDPFGHEYLIGDSLRLKSKLIQIIERLDEDQYLIVTSRQELICELECQDNLSLCKLSNYQWNDLSISKTEKLISFWDQLTKKNQISIDKSLQHKLLDHGVLQIGEISQLIAIQKDNHNAYSLDNIDKIYNYIKSNSDDLAKYIYKDRNLATMISILALASNTFIRISTDDLTYILSDCKQLASKQLASEQFEIHLFSKNKKCEYPTYPNDLSNITSEAGKLLDMLCEKRYITLDRDSNSYYFSHPNFYEAARKCLTLFHPQHAKELESYYERILFCLSPNNAIIIIKQLNHLATIPNLKDKTIEIAYKGLDSIYPKIQDACIEFIANNLKYYNTPQYKNVLNKICQCNNTSDIKWHKDSPYVCSSMSSVDSLSTMIDILRIKPLNEKEIEAKIKNKSATSLEIWTYIKYIKNYSLTISQEILCKILTATEEFVKAEALSIAIQKNEINDFLITTIRNEKHPYTNFTIIHAVFLRWNNCIPREKNLLKRIILKKLSNRITILRAVHLIFNPATDYSGTEYIIPSNISDKDKAELWSLWVDCFEVCIENLPTEIHPNFARFTHNILCKAKPYLSDKDKIRICQTWFKLIEILYEINRLDDKNMALPYLLLSVNKQHKCRLAVSQKIFKMKSTHYILYNLSIYIGKWDNLLASEKELLLKLIESDRNDIQWIKAYLIANPNTPKCIIKKITGNPDLLTVPPEQLIRTLDNDLVYILRIYTNIESDIFNQNENIDNIIEYILMQQQDSPFFKLCLDYYIQAIDLRDGKNPGTHNIKDITYRIGSKSTSYFKLLISTTIKYSIIINNARLQEVWEHIYSLCVLSKANKDLLISELIKNYSKLESAHKNLLHDIIGKDNLFLLWQNINPDNEIAYKALQIKTQQECQELLRDHRLKDIKTNLLRRIVNNITKKFNIGYTLNFEYEDVDIMSYAIDEELDNWNY